MKKGFIGLAMTLASAVAINSYGQKPAVVTNNDPGWKKIGQTTASFKMQNESITVLGADEFTALKLKVKDAPIDIERLQVFYESGDMEEVSVSDLNMNGESSVIRLKHPDRDIQKVAFTYKTEANARGEKAEVELYGLKTNQPTGKDAYRDDAREMKKDADRAADDARDEAREAGDDAERNADRTGERVKGTANDIGDDVKEGVNDAAAAIKDTKLKDKVGPGGETAYVDDNGKYYYINDQGKKVFITKLQLKDKPDNR